MTEDKGNGGQQTWREVKLAHGNAVIGDVLVSQGYSMGTDVSALVKTVTFNGKCFKFDVAPANGDKGDKGDKGDQGSTGATGSGCYRCHGCQRCCWFQRCQRLPRC